MRFEPRIICQRLKHPYCPVCGSLLGGDEKVFCTECLAQMPYTYWHGAAGNPLERLFYNDTYRIGHANALLYYNSNPWVQNLVALFKVQRRRDILETLTEFEVQELLETDFFEGIDAIVPAPLHPKRERQRGYNQAVVIAETVSRITGIPVKSDLLLRTEDSISMARSGTQDRSAHVRGIFAYNGQLPDCTPQDIPQPQRFVANAHLLLVDDTVTTGSTLRECAITLAPDRTSQYRLSFMTLFVTTSLYEGYTSAEIAAIRRGAHKE